MTLAEYVDELNARANRLMNEVERREMRQVDRKIQAQGIEALVAGASAFRQAADLAVKLDAG